jgi:hypothetical protein
VVFVTIATNNVALLVVHPNFFVDRNSWHRAEIASTATHLDVTAVTIVAGLQERLLDGKYLDRTRFGNVTGSECDARYGAFFVTADKCDEFCRMNLHQRNSNGFSFQKNQI